MPTHKQLLKETIDLECLVMNETMQEQMNGIAKADLTLQQFRILLFVLSRKHAAITDAAEFIGVKPNVATGIIQRLVDKNLLERIESATDRRVRLLQVSAYGQTFMQEALGNALTLKQNQYKRLSLKQLEDYRDILHAMLDPDLDKEKALENDTNKIWAWFETQPKTT